jgi:CubicO group peptidase (beta-lactamase class C family)
VILRTKLSLSIGTILILLLGLSLGQTAIGQKELTKKANPLSPRTKVETPSSEAAIQTGPHEMTPQDVETFLDGVMPLQLRREDVAGAVITIVKDGKPFFSKGYGYADVEKKIPVSPSGTLFRPGSISKLFTWTAVMQLQEQGKIDLDKDVNDYIDYKIPATYPKPITMRDLMTHTPGFEEVLQLLFIADAKDLIPLGDYMKQHLPERIYPPFTVPAYSNYGAALAGYIVERVSGQKFDDYIDEHIFKPLDMRHATFRQPLPGDLKSMMSNGYTRGSDKPGKFEVVQAAPAGSLAATGEDMTHFMIAHLQDGKYGDTQILKPETARLMHSRTFENLPTMNAMCLGFYEETRNGHRIIGHAGDTGYFHSDLHLMLDQNLGFFVSYNSAGKGESSPRITLWHAFLDRYFPYQPPAAQAPSTAAQGAEEVSGRYISSRRAQTTILKPLTALSESKIEKNSDGTISAEEFKDLNGKPKKFAEIGPMLFREVDGQDKLGFKRDDEGKWVGVGDYPFEVMQTPPWYENSALDMPILVCSLIVFVLVILAWPIAAIIRKHYDRPLDITPEQRKLRRMLRIVAILDLLFLAALAVYFSSAEQNLGLLDPKFNPLIRLIQCVGWLGMIGMVASCFYFVKAWGVTRWWGSRLGNAVATLACLGFAYWVFVWNLLHWSLRY